MTEAARHLLEAFRTLPDLDKREVLAALLREAIQTPYPPPSDGQSRFEAVVPVPFLKPGAFDAQRIVTVPSVRLIRSLGVLSGAQLEPVEKAVLRWLGFEGSGA